MISRQSQNKLKMDSRKVILYIAMSLDGYIAKTNNDLDFLSIVEQEGEDYGYYQFLETVDTVIMGRKTIDKLISMDIKNPHPNKKTYVLTRTKRPNSESIYYYHEDLSILIHQLKQQTGKHIFCDGGAETAHSLFQSKLIDECIISIIPIFLGNGVRLFNEGCPEQRLTLLESKSFEKGLVQLHYQINQIQLNI